MSDPTRCDFSSQTSTMASSIRSGASARTSVSETMRTSAGRSAHESSTRRATVAARFARIARKARVERIESIVTAPGRQAENHKELMRTLSKATRAPVTLLSADDEGRLAWEGAVATVHTPTNRVAVVDLGGGSCEVAVGYPSRGPSWIRSIDAGALRVTRAFLGGDPPDDQRIARARREITELARAFDPPRPDTALAVGGTARAVSRIAGEPFGVSHLESLCDRALRSPSCKGDRVTWDDSGTRRDPPRRNARARRGRSASGL